MTNPYGLLLTFEENFERGWLIALLEDEHAFSSYICEEREIRMSHFIRAVCAILSSMQSDRDLKLALGWNRWNMELVGIWPEPNRSSERWSNIKVAVFIFIITYFGTGPQSANLFFIWPDLELVTENLSTANIPGINAVLKLIIAWHHRDALKPVVKAFYNDWKDLNAKEEKETMLNRAKSGNQISIWCSMLTLTMVTVYLSLRAWIVCQIYRTNVKQDRLLLYPGYFPYNIRPIEILLLSNFGQVLAAYSAVIAYTTVDTFIAMLIIHTCGQFEILRKKLQRIMGDDERIRNSDEIHKDLVFIVQRHEHLIWVSGKIEECFNMLLLIQMLLCTIEICFQGFLFFNGILKGENGIFNFQLLFFVLFVCFILVHIYIYCYIGEMLLVQSKEMGMSAYESNWFNISPKEAKRLLFIMYRSTRPLCLTAGNFGIFSMEMFSTILRTAMGYLSVLLTVASSD